jgi:ribonuclease BN (tRNA processing enzyme)
MLLAGSVGAAVAAPALLKGSLTTPAHAQATEVPTTGTHLVTLGTAAGPAVRSERRGYSTALVVDGDLYLVDCGLGMVRQAIEAQLPRHRLRLVLLTHLHSDHIVELPGLMLFNWGPAWTASSSRSRSSAPIGRAHCRRERARPWLRRLRARWTWFAT